MNIKPGDFADPRVKALLSYHLMAMREASPPGHSFALDWSALKVPEIGFYAGWEGEALVAIGALKDHGGGQGEIKSMRVLEDQRGKGYGEAILVHIIAQARRRCLHRISLETGSGPVFEAALKLYRKHGFRSGAAFADYVPSDFCQFYHLDLSSSRHQ